MTSHSRPLLTTPEIPLGAECRSALVSSIERECTRGAQQQFGTTLRSVVLTGSLAREEGSFSREDGRWKLLGDAELLYVFKDAARLPSAAQIQTVREGIETNLSEQGLLCSISLSGAHADYLARMKPHIFAYELRTNGRVLAGDPDILSVIPAFPSYAIPLEDAWWMLCNRIVEQLETLSVCDLSTTRLPDDLSYRTVKLYLDMATSFLIFLGAYEPTYRERARRLRAIASSENRSPLPPFNLLEFSRWVDICTQQKLSSLGALESAQSWVMWASAVRYARQLWFWELARIFEVTEPTDVRNAMQRWARTQPFVTRMRGWLYVLRASSWLKSYRQWPRWVQKVWIASPRYWVYAAAAQLFFCLAETSPEGLQKGDPQRNWQELREWLPDPRLSAANATSDWRGLGSAIAWNYHSFLEQTRS
jgi:hypothetical protein